MPKSMVKCIILVLVSLVLCDAAKVVLSWGLSVGNQGTTNITVGDSVTWVWSEAREHSIMSTSISHPFQSSDVVSVKGYRYTVNFTAPGHFTYQCSIHGAMRGAIYVTTQFEPSSAPSHFPTHSSAPSLSQSPSIETTMSPTSAPTVSPYPTPIPPTSQPSITHIPSIAPTPLPSTATGMPSTEPTSLPTSIEDLLRREIVFPDILSSSYNRPRKWFLNLYVREHRHDIGPMSFTTRSFCYTTVVDTRCSYPGPTIRLWPGDNLTLTVINELGNDWTDQTHHWNRTVNVTETRNPFDSNDTIVDPTHTFSYNNTMHGANTTNFYAHGLRISPQVNSPLFAIKPGQSRTYQYDIRTDHAPGVHWYYAAHQGSSALQIMNGLTGAIIMAPEPDNKATRYPTALKNARFLLLFVTRVVLSPQKVNGVLSQGCGEGQSCNPLWQPTCTGSETSSPFNAFREYSLDELSREAGSHLHTNIAYNTSYHNPYKSVLNIVNGMHKPTIALFRNSPSVLQFVNAGGGGPLRLKLNNNHACSWAVLAWDGVYIKNRSPQLVLNVVAGGRVEVEILCKTDGSYTIVNIGNDILLHVVVSYSNLIKRTVTSENLAGIRKPPYLLDLYDANATIDQWFSVSVNQDNKNLSNCGFWMGSGPDCSNVKPFGTEDPDPDSSSCSFTQFAGARGNNPWDYLAANRIVTFPDSVHEWTLYGGGSSHHPLSVQPHHFQIMDVSTLTGYEEYYEIGQWRDTIPPIAGYVTFRFRVAKYEGENAYKCHFLRHQDLGMMDTFLVINYETFQQLTTSPTQLPTQTPDDDLIGPLGFMWVIIIAAGVVAIGGGVAAYLTFCSPSNNAHVFPKNDFG